MNRVFAARNPFEAHLVQGLLEAKGIEAEVRGEDLFSVRGEVPFEESLASVWVVADHQEEEAEALVAAYIRGESPDVLGALAWRCPSCNEQHEPQFTVCWKCGAERPDAPQEDRAPEPIDEST
jgi:hypothetical protein